MKQLILNFKNTLKRLTSACFTVLLKDPRKTLLHWVHAENQGSTLFLPARLKDGRRGEKGGANEQLFCSFKQAIQGKSPGEESFFKVVSYSAIYLCVRVFESMPDCM